MHRPYPQMNHAVLDAYAVKAQSLHRFFQLRQRIVRHILQDMHHVAHGLHIGAVVWHERGKPPHRLLCLRVGASMRREQSSMLARALPVSPASMCVCARPAACTADSTSRFTCTAEQPNHTVSAADHRQQHPEGE